MGTSLSTKVQEAETLMSERRFPEAIAAFEAHLEQSPYDLRALLKVGICHLLNCSRGAFLESHRRAEEAIARIGSVPADVADLWALYRDLVVRVGAATLVAGTLVLGQGGCAHSEGSGDGGTVAEDAGTTKPPRPAHRYSGGVFLERREQERNASPEPAQQPPASSQDGLAPPPAAPSEPAAKKS